MYACCLVKLDINIMEELFIQLCITLPSPIQVINIRGWMLMTHDYDILGFSNTE